MIDHHQLTYSPSIEAWRRSATEVPLIQDNAQHPLLSFATFSSSEVIKDTSASQRKPLYDYVNEERVVLRNLTELHFTPPDNTSFVEVQGPIRNDEYYWGVRDRNMSCAAILDPLPPWWNTTAGPPLAWQFGPVNISHRPMFLLPLDPTVRYTIKVLPRYNTSICSVNKFTAYPYF